jgi:hypothetical protein
LALTAIRWSQSSKKPVHKFRFVKGGLKMIKVYEFGFNPYAEFKKGGLLEGFDQDAVSGDDYETERARNLYDILGAGLEDDKYILGQLSNGKWALISETVWGYMFAVED